MKKVIIVLLSLIVLLLIGFKLLQKDPVSMTVLKKKYTNEASSFLEMDGMQVHYRIEGNGEPLVLIHGTGASLQTWDSWTDSLKNYYQVIRMDIPAFGLTGPNKTGNYSLEYYVQFIDDFTKAIGVDSFILGGNSLGGEIAWKYALAHPERTKSLLLLAPAGSPVQTYDIPFFSAFRLARIPILANNMSDIDTKFLVKNTLRQAYEKDELITHDKEVMYYDMSMREGNRVAFIQRLNQISGDSLLDPSKVTTPTLILWGKQDAVLLIEQFEGFKSMPSMKSIIYDGVGHTPQDEASAQSVTDALMFLRAQ